MLCSVQQDYAQCFTTSRSHAWNPGMRELTSEFASKPFNHFTNSLQLSLQAGKHFTAHLTDRQKNPSIFSFRHNPGIFYLEQTESVHSALLCGITSESETSGDRDGQRRGVARAPVAMQRRSVLTATPLSLSLVLSIHLSNTHTITLAVTLPACWSSHLRLISSE